MVIQKLRKAFTVSIAFVCSTNLFSQVSIGGVSVSAGQEEAKTIETKFGALPVKEGTPVEYYESGAVKSFFIDDKSGTVYASIEIAKQNPGITFTNGDMRVVTPYPSQDYMQSRKTKPVEFYENGNLKSVRLANVKYGKSLNDYPEIVLSNDSNLNGEKLCIRKDTTVEFYESGKIKSVVVPQNQSFNFLLTMNPKAVFKNFSTVEFYENGNLKSFLLASDINLTLKNPFGIAVRFDKPVTLSPIDSNMILSFTPANGTKLNLGNDVKIYFVDDMPVTFYEDGKNLKEITWRYDAVSFMLGGAQFIGANDTPFETTVKFNQNGNVESISGKKSSVFIYVIEDRKVPVNEIRLDENLNLLYSEHKTVPLVISEKAVKNGSKNGKEKTLSFKIYYKDGKRTAVIGRVEKIFVDPSNFYASSYNSADNCILFYSADKVSKVITSEKQITLDSEIYFDEKENPVSYSVFDYEGNRPVEKIK